MTKSSAKLTMVVIADRRGKAAHTLQRLPPVKAQSFKSNRPAVINEFHEAYGYNDAEVRLGPSSAKHITEMDETSGWMILLTSNPEYTRKLVWLRANRVRWKAIMRRLPGSRTKLSTDYRNALMTILLALN